MFDMQLYEINARYPAIYAGAGVEKSHIKIYDSLSFDTLFSTQTRRIFVTDSNVAKLPIVASFLDKSRIALSLSIVKADDDNAYPLHSNIAIIIDAGEENKNINNVLAIVKAAINASMSRQVIFTAIGGGVISDMTAFAASIFKRGVAFEVVPTTLLAMVDASLGGKTGADFDKYKNMIGSFWPAKVVHIFPDFIKTLDSIQYKSGLAEALKTAFLFPNTNLEDNNSLYNLFTKNISLILQKDMITLKRVIALCVKAKMTVVEKDFTEHGERAFLNLGHTLGHALETVAGFGAISHGEAIAWGMSRALEISHNLNLCEEKFYKEAMALIADYGYFTNNCPPCICAINPTERKELFIKAIQKDKKNTDNAIRMILQKNWGETFIKEVRANDILTVL